MATERGKNRTRNEDNDQDAESGHDDYNNLPKNDQQTLHLVRLVKTKLQETDNPNKSITKEDVEVATYNGRYELKQNGYDIKKWKRDPSINVVKSSEELIVQSMAYAMTPEQAAPILKIKQEQMDKTPRTSLESIIQPLKELQNNTQGERPKNLFAAVLEIDQDKIDRADRMFFIEARRLLGEPDDYTLDKAHHQVQAIRLMHYETNDEKKLRNFIEKCTTFDLAYAHLRGLARDRVEKSETNTNTTNKKFTKPLAKEVNYDGDDNRDDSRVKLINSASSNNRSPQNQSHEDQQTTYRGNENRGTPRNNRNSINRQKYDD